MKAADSQLGTLTTNNYFLYPYPRATSPPMLLSDQVHRLAVFFKSVLRAINAPNLSRKHIFEEGTTFGE